MKGFHSTVTRREFMKGMGLAGASLGAGAAIAGPAFHDLDELAASSKSQQPWWVKERDHPRSHGGDRLGNFQTL